MMRFLCLHGFATNVKILEQQMLPLTAHLPSDWEFEFLEASMEPSTLILRQFNVALLLSPYIWALT